MRGLPPRLAASTVLVLVAAIAPPASGGSVPPVEPYRTDDRSVVALNILPPGQGRYMNFAEFLEAQGSGEEPPHNADQLELYAGLIQGVPSITDTNLTNFFKDAS